MSTEHTKADLEKKKTLSKGKCCDLKEDTPTKRVWLCRVTGEVCVEVREPHAKARWQTIQGH